jgi:hypothetical protein
MRGSIDRYPGSKLGKFSNLTGQKKFKNIEQKSHSNAPGQIRKGNANKQLRTKSSVSGTGVIDS